MMGRIICNRLGKEGSQMVVAYRGDEWDARSLKLCGDLGQVWFQVAAYNSFLNHKKSFNYKVLLLT
jgi:hypothetical protein